MGALAGPHRFARHHSPSPWPHVQARFWGLCGLGWGEVPAPPGSQGTCPHADTLGPLPGRPDVSFQPPVTSAPSTPTTHVPLQEPAAASSRPPDGIPGQLSPPRPVRGVVGSASKPAQSWPLSPPHPGPQWPRGWVLLCAPTQCTLHREPKHP